MLNQLRRIWSDNGSNDKDFTPQEERLKKALTHLKEAADLLSKASAVLIDEINSGR